MFKIDTNTKQIKITRGDIGILGVTAKNQDGTPYEFQPNDVVRLKVTQKKDVNDIKLVKDVVVQETTTNVDLELTSQDTTIDGLINKSVDYWYEIELNPETNPQTIIGYDDDGAKLFTLFPEGGDE